MNIDTLFCRQLLRQTHADIRRIFPEIKNVVACCGVTRSMRGQWFVQIATAGRAMFNYDCRAYNATDARCKGWAAFMRQYAPAQLVSA